jgi:tetratricopeptide (TPR) repeat protein
MLESMPRSESLPKGRAAALKALELDGNLAEAYSSLGWIAFGYDWDIRAAQENFRKALELNPNYPTAHQWRGLMFMNTGRHDEALREVRRARELDPLSPIINAAVGFVLFFTGHHDEAEQELLKTLEMDPGFAPIHHVLGWIHEKRGDHEQAVEEQKMAFSLEGEHEMAKALEESFRKSGYDGAIRAMREYFLKAKTRLASRYCSAAELSAMLGEYERAYELLEKAIEEREPEVVFMRVLPGFDSIRAEPRFQELLKRIGISDDDIRDLPE